MIEKNEHNKNQELLALEIFDNEKNIKEEEVNSVAENGELRQDLQLLNDVRSFYRKNQDEKPNVEKILSDFHLKHDKGKIQSVFSQHTFYAIVAVAAILLICILLHLSKDVAANDDYLASITQPGPVRVETEDGQKIKVKQKNDHVACFSMTDIKEKLSDNSTTEPILFYVPAGKSLDLNLPDGSTAYIHAGSIVVFPSSFTGNNREMTVEEGEVYFKVNHDAKHPFIVNANGVKTVAMGTEFDVNTHHSLTEVTLITGAVSVSTSAVKQILLPNQQASCSEGKIKVANVDATSYKSWSQGYYFFDNEELQNIIYTLASGYGMKTEYLDTTHIHTKLHFVSERNGTIDDAIDLLNRTKKIHIRRNDNTIIIEH